MERKDTWPDRGPVLAFAALGLLAATCGLWDLWGPDEGRYALVARELLGRGDWWMLRIFGKAYDQKPPLPFWIFAGMIKLGGGQISSWLLRLPSVCFAALTIFCTQEIGRRRLGARVGWLAAIMVATSEQFLSDAPTVELDMMLTGWLTLAACAWLSRPDLTSCSIGRRIVIWGAFAAAFLTKGPPALLILPPIIIGEAWSARSWRVFWASGIIYGLPLGLVPIGIWLYCVKRTVGADYVEGQIAAQTVTRFLKGDHANPFYYYLPRVFVGIFGPWSPLLIPAGIRWWRERRTPNLHLAPIIAWLIIPFVVFSIASGKRQAYLLPLIPPMALAAAWWLDGSGWLERGLPRLKRFFQILAPAVGILLLIAAPVIGFRRDLVWHVGFFATTPVAVAMGLWGTLLLLLVGPLRRVRSDGLSMVHVFAIGVAGFYLFNCTVVRPAMNPSRSSKVFARELSSHLDAAGLEHIVGAIERAEKTEFHAYGDYRIVTTQEEDIGDGSRLPTMIVAREEDWIQRFDVLTAAGFRLRRRSVASGEPLVIARRNPPVRGRETAPNPPFTFALTSDTGENSSRMFRLAQTMAGSDSTDPFKAMFLMGDNIYGDDPFNASIDPRFKQVFKDLLARNVRIQATMGNHEDIADLRSKCLTFPTFNMDGQAYYQVVFGSLATFFVLDSQPLLETPEEYLWFKNALKQCNTPWRFVLMHMPLDASAKANGARRDHYRILRPLLTGKHGVQAVFTGHNHFYERRVPRDGVLHVTAGGTSDLDAGPFPPDPARAAGYNEDGVFIRLVVDVASARGEAINANGEVIDTFDLAPAK